MTKPSKSEKPEAETRKAGQPTKYLPEYCEKVIELGKLGCNQSQMAVNLGIGESTLYLWMKDRPEFLEAVTRGNEESLNWWVATGKSGLTYQTQHGPRMDYSGYNFLMQSMFPAKYRQNHIPESERRTKAKLELELLIQRKEIEAAEALQRQVKADDDARIRALDIEIKKKLVAGEIVQDQSAVEAFGNFAKYMNTAAEKLHKSNRQKQDDEGND